MSMTALGSPRNTVSPMSGRTCSVQAQFNGYIPARRRRRLTAEQEVLSRPFCMRWHGRFAQVRQRARLFAEDCSYRAQYSTIVHFGGGPWDGWRERWGVGGMDGAFQRPIKEGLIATIVIEDADPDSVEALLAYVIGYTQACPTTAPTGSLQKFSAGLF